MAAHLVGRKRLSFDCRLVGGAMIFRAGPDEKRDRVAFCGRGNAHEEFAGAFLGHFWLIDCNGDLIDFSAGLWRREFEKCSGGPADLRENGEPFGPIEWVVEPPKFYWEKAENLTSGWKSTGAPKIGGVWYREGLDIHPPASKGFIREFAETIIEDFKTMTLSEMEACDKKEMWA